MLVGVTLMKSSDPYYCPGFPRAGNTAMFTVEVLNREGSATLDLTVETKNSADTTWTVLGAFGTISSTTTSTIELSGMKEMLRLKYEVGGTAASDFMHLYVFPPAWKA